MVLSQRTVHDFNINGDSGHYIRLAEKLTAPGTPSMRGIKRFEVLHHSLKNKDGLRFQNWNKEAVQSVKEDNTTWFLRYEKEHNVVFITPKCVYGKSAEHVAEALRHIEFC